MASRAPRPHTGGPRRRLDLATVRDQELRLLVQPATPERTVALRKVRSAMRSIQNRSPRNGA